MKNENFTILTEGKAKLHDIYKILTTLSTQKMWLLCKQDRKKTNRVVPKIL